jgi:flagellar hook assembly protein FlgD
LEHQNEIDMAIFNINGQLIQTLKSGIQPAGAHSVVWNGKNALGELVGSGVYIYSLSTPEKTVSKRLIFLK